MADLALALFTAEVGITPAQSECHTWEKKCILVTMFGTWGLYELEPFQGCHEGLTGLI